MLKKTILIVDDALLNRKILAEIFKDKYNIIEAQDGIDAIKILKKNYDKISLVLLDLYMPKKDGFEVLAEMQADKNIMEIPVIVISVENDAATEVKALEYGACDYICKPFEPSTAKQRAKNAIRNHELAQLRAKYKLLKEQSVAQVQLQAILDNMIGGIVLIEVGKKLRAIYKSKGFYSVANYTEEAYKKYDNDMLMRIVPEDREQLQENIINAVKNNSSFSQDYRCYSPNGEIMWIHMQGIQIAYPNSKFPVVIAILTDITQSHKTQQALKNTTNEISAMINSVPGGFAIFNIQADIPKIDYINDGVLKMYGYTKQEFLQKYGDNFFESVYLDDIDLCKKSMKIAAVTGEPFENTIRIATKDNNIVWTLIKGQAVTDHNNNQYFYCVLIDITKEKTYENKLKLQAEYDMLTGLYNRDAFYSKVNKILHRNLDSKFVLVRWNIERFKIINELFGKARGDLLLKEIGQAIKTDFGDISICGRIEADHFVICIPKKSFDIDTITLKTSEFVKKQKEKNSLVITIGIYEIEDISLPVDQMCDRANLALQTVKGNYNLHYAVYDDSLRQSMLKEEYIRDDMENALKNNEFQIFLQPIYSLSSKAAVSAEVLVRWFHPKKGMISPAAFIPLFEKNGFIAKLDYYVWEKACQYLKSRQDAGLPRMPISVNASRMSLYNPDFCNLIVALTEKYEIDPWLFKIEITESAYNDNPEQLISTIKMLKEQGYSVMMDDFGSGYSSLNTLKDIPVDVLKIDMKFMQGFENGGRVGTIVTSVIRMAKWLELQVVAEGIETKQQVDFMHSIGCDRIQGYYFARPMCCEDFEKYEKENCHGNTAEIIEIIPSSDVDAIFGGNKFISTIMDSVFGGIGFYELVDDKLEAIRVNDSYYKIMGYTSKTFMQDAKNIFSKVYEEDKAAAKNACLMAVKSKKSVRVVIRRYHFDGHLMYLDSVYSYVGGIESQPMICIAFIDITETVLAQQKIKLSEERYRVVAQRSGTIMLEWNIDDASFTSEKGYENYTISNLLHNRLVTKKEEVTAAVHPDDAEKMWTFVCNKNNYEKYSTADIRLKTIKGDYQWCRISDNYIRDADGKLIKIIATVNNIDMQKRDELRLAETAEKLKIITENLSNGIALFEIASTIKTLYGNKALFEQIGCEPQENANQDFNVLSIVHADDRRMLMQSINDAIEKNINVLCKYRIITKQGVIKWMKIEATKLENTKCNNPVFLAAITDITDLKETSLQLETTVKNMNAGVVLYEITDTESNIIFANDFYYQMTGYTKQELNNNTFFLINNKDKQMLQKLIKKAKKDKKPFTYAYRITKKDGSTAWFSCSIAVMQMANYIAPVFFTIRTDITEQKNLEHHKELSKYSNALFGVYDEVFEMDFENNQSVTLSTKYKNISQKLNQIKLKSAVQNWVYEHVYPEYKELLETFLSKENRENIKVSKKSETIEYKIINNDGKDFWVSSTLIYVGGNQYLLCNKNITKLKEIELIEQKNKSLEKELYEQQRYKIIVEQAGTTIVEWDLINGEFYYSDSYKQFEMSRKKPEDLLENNADLDTVHPDDLPSLIQFFKDTKSGKNTAETVMRLKMVDGSYKRTRMVATFIKDKNGKPIRTIGTMNILE